MTKKELELKTELKQLALSSLAFGLILFLCLLPTLFQGGFKAFIDYGFLNKGRYVLFGHPAYFLVPEKWKSYDLFIFSSPFLLLTLFGLNYRTLKKERNHQWMILFFFLIASYLTLYPRADNPQKIVYLPLALIAIGYFFTKIPHFIKTKYLLKFSLITYSSASLLFPLSQPFFALKNQHIGHSSIQHFKGIMMPSSQIQHWEELQKEFLAQHTGKPVFFLSTHCGFYYLLFHLSNPTPFDFPKHPAFGLQGENFLLQQVASRKVEKIYMDHKERSNWGGVGAQRPFLLEQFIKSEMKRSRFDQFPFLDTYFEAFTLNQAE